MAPKRTFDRTSFPSDRFFTRWCAVSPHFRKILMRKPRRQFFAMSRRDLYRGCSRRPLPLSGSSSDAFRRIPSCVMPPPEIWLATWRRSAIELQ